MLLLPRLLCRSFGAINAQYLLNKNRTAFRFESQGVTWDYEEVNYHVNAAAKGLTSNGFQTGDSILVKMAPKQQTEACVIKLGAQAIGVKVIQSLSKSSAELKNQLKDTNAKGFVFEPTLPMASSSLIDGLYEAAPELKRHHLGQSVDIRDLPSLKLLVQTNFYSYAGVYKFRSLLNYASDKYFKIQTGDQSAPIALPPSSNPIIITSVFDDFSFRAGVLNSVVGGRYVVVADNLEVLKSVEALGGSVDYVGSEGGLSLPDNVNLFVSKGSNLYASFRNRTEL